MDIRTSRNSIKHKQGEQLFGLLLFVSVITILFGSYIASDYSFDFVPQGNLLTGRAVIVLQGDVSMSAGVSATYDSVYTGVSETHFVTLLNDTTLDPISDANCNVTHEQFEVLVYDSQLGQYTTTHAYDTPGNYSLTFECSRDEGNIFISQEIIVEVKQSAPDFTISVTQPNDVIVNQEASFTITIENEGPDSYSGTLTLQVESDMSSTENVDFVVSSFPHEYTYQKTYTETGSDTLTFTINPTQSVTEIDYDDNSESESVTVSQGTQNICGTLSSSTTLTQNQFCSDGVQMATNGLILDCNGYRIYGESQLTGGTGLEITQSATIRNCTIDSYKTGIHATAAVTIEDSTIEDTTVGIKLDASLSEVTRTTLEDNTVGLESSQSNTVSETDFIDNSYAINSSAQLIASYNYFGTTDYVALTALIQNTTALTLVPYYDESTFSSSKTLIYPFDGPELSSSVTLRELEEYTQVSLSVTTNEEADCRYSEKVESFSDLSTFKVSNETQFDSTLPYYEEGIYSFYIHCLDNDNNPNTTTTENFTIRRVHLFLLEQIRTEIADYEELLDDEKEDRDDINEDLETAAEFEKERLEGELEEIEIDITYYDELINVFSDLENDVEDLDEDLTNLIDEDLEEHEDKLEDLNNTLGNTSILLSESISNDSITIDALFELQLSSLESYYSTLIRNETDTFKKNKLFDDHILSLYISQIGEIEAKKTRYTSLDELGQTSYDSVIAGFDDDLETLDEELYDENKSQKRTDLENELDFLDYLIEDQKDYIEELQDLKDDLEDREDFADANNHNDLEQELKRLQLDTQENIESTNDFILDIERDIELINEEIELLDEFGLNYTINRTSPTEEDEEEQNETKENITLDIAKTYQITWNTSEEKPFVSINFSELFFLHEIRTSIIDSLNTSLIELSVLSSNPFGTVLGVETFEWYFINITNGTNISEISLEFLVNAQELELFNTSFEKLQIYTGSGSWTPLQTLLENKTNESNQNETGLRNLRLSTTIASLGYFALGYSTVEDNESTCVAIYTCKEYGSCIEGQRTRECRDTSACGTNQTVNETETCSTGDGTTQKNPTCDDGIQNQDEEGIDCGGSCIEKCSVEEQPTNVSDEEKSERGKFIYLVLFLSFLFLGILGFILTANTDALSSVMKQLKTKAYDSIDDGAILNAFAKRNDEATIIKELIEKGVKEEDAIHRLQVIKYILQVLDIQKDTNVITQSLVKQGWGQEIADRLVKKVAAHHLVTFIEDFSGGEQQNSDDLEVIKEMLINEGYSQEIVMESVVHYKRKYKNLVK